MNDLPLVFKRIVVLSPERAPLALSAAYFCMSPNLALYFLSDPDSLHCRNLLTNRSMAVTIFSSAQQWGSPDKGLQLFGNCSEARGSYQREAKQLYQKRFPSFNATPNTIRYRFYRFVPRQIKILDEKRFGAGVFITLAVRPIRAV